MGQSLYLLRSKWQAQAQMHVKHCLVRLQVTGYRSAAEVPGRLAHGCYLSGLYLEGAAWNAARGCLTRQRPMARAPSSRLLKDVITKTCTKKNCCCADMRAVTACSMRRFWSDPALQACWFAVIPGLFLSEQELVEELPLVRLEPADSARLPHGGTLRTPVYMTQARVHAYALGTGVLFWHGGQALVHCHA